ncbi:hypothetical protein NX059_011429 [Plenodomus lindquistii]|nr:hypothetical protein NX059_011429 [Plenodomus lindquistii]
MLVCFAPRALVICTAILRLMWLYPSTPHGQPQFRLWLPTIITQVQVCLSVITAFVPYMLPLIRSIEGNLSRSESVKRKKHHLDESYMRIVSSLWSRRHQSCGPRDSTEPQDAVDNDYKPISFSTPHLAPPRPMSPTTPLTVHSSSLRSSSKNGLCISMPLAQRMPESDMLSSCTASSFALSPTCASPQPFLAPRKPPSPRPKAPSSSSASEDICFKSTKQDIPRTGRFSLFPSQGAGSRSPQSCQEPSTSPLITYDSSLLSTMPSSGFVSPLLTTLTPPSAPNTVQPAKISTTPKLTSPPPTTHPLSSLAKHQIRPDSIQDLNSPMGAALNNFFGSSGNVSPGGHVRGHRCLTPFTSSQKIVPDFVISHTARGVPKHELLPPVQMLREGRLPL